MIISIDYDDTFTRDKILWTEFIKSSIMRGHTVVCVTARCETYDSREVIEDLGHLVEIYFTCGKPKQKFMFNKGICVHVWIDDCPEAIVPRQVLNTWGERINYD
jgi:hypothetical protein